MDEREAPDPMTRLISFTTRSTKALADESVRAKDRVGVAKTVAAAVPAAIKCRREKSVFIRVLIRIIVWVQIAFSDGAAQFKSAVLKIK